MFLKQNNELLFERLLKQKQKTIKISRIIALYPKIKKKSNLTRMNLSIGWINWKFRQPRIRIIRQRNVRKVFIFFAVFTGLKIWVTAYQTNGTLKTGQFTCFGWCVWFRKIVHNVLAIGEYFPFSNLRSTPTIEINSIFQCK